VIVKRTLYSERVRKINGSFAFIEHRFLRNGFWKTLSHHELLLYIFLVLVSDRRGLSYYYYDKICNILKINVNEYIAARNALIKKDLIGFDGRLFQVLSLPEHPVFFKAETIGDKRQTAPKSLVAIGEILHEILPERRSYKGHGIC
jgi:hypothetical protein